jgi:feruloyl esterase
MIVLGIFLLVAMPSQATAQAQARAQACEKLQTASVAVDVPATIDRVVEPATCRVSGTISKRVHFIMLLPHGGWNGRYLQLGCGGLCGTLRHVAQCDGPVSKGYACIVNDRGHDDNEFALANASRLWPQGNLVDNLGTVIDYAYLAEHQTALVGKAIALAFYGRPVAWSYFVGCSAGGQSGMREAELFPADFNGIVAGCPSLDFPRNVIGFIWNARVLTGPDGKDLLSAPDIDLLHNAVVSACDMNDGIADGIIGDPRRCAFQPRVLLCKVGQTGLCLTQQQVRAVEQVYDGPPLAPGRRLYPVTLRGSEKSWPTFTTSLKTYSIHLVRHLLLERDPGDAWTLSDFNIERDYDRFAFADLIWGGTNTDLRRFQERGGKILMYSGWADPVEGVLRTVDFYETTARTVGQLSTQTFFRLFVIPGMSHCDPDSGISAVNYLDYIVPWVERGLAPTDLVTRRFGPSVRDRQALFPAPADLVGPSRRIHPLILGETVKRQWK